MVKLIDITGYILQAVLFLAFAPLASGMIKMVKARLQNRRGPGIFQVYRDIGKLLRKDSVVSPTVSWIFYAAPFCYFGAALAAAALTPVLQAGTDFFALIYLLAFGRFFLALASLDAGSSFGGMGGSREMFISVLVEPALFLALLIPAFKGGSTDLTVMASAASANGFTLSHIFALLAFFIVLIAETGRIPVDNPDTHLELTMIHEGMVLEYSGRFLGLISWAASIKQMVVILLFVMLYLPVYTWGIAGITAAAVVTGVAIACMETATNKIRLFRVPGLLALSGLLSLLALVAQ